MYYEHNIYIELILLKYKIIHKNKDTWSLIQHLYTA